MNFSTKEYFVREAYKSIRRNGFMSVASIATVAVSLMVFGIFLLLFLNSNNLAQHLEKQVQVSVYMQDDAKHHQGHCHSSNGSNAHKTVTTNGFVSFAYEIFFSTKVHSRTPHSFRHVR